jgi:DNA-binding NarL/FixJ family response regulator
LSEIELQSTSAAAQAAATAPAKTVRENLTPREAEVLNLLADGLTSREIAERLRIGFKTATSHRNNILTKLGVHSTVSAVRWAIRKGLIEP